VETFISRFESDPNAKGLPGQMFAASRTMTTPIDAAPGPGTILFGTTPGMTIQGFTLDQVPTPEPSGFSIFAMATVAWIASRVLLRNQRT
jgi:hypothetical protein